MEYAVIGIDLPVEKKMVIDDLNNAYFPISDYKNVKVYELFWEWLGKEENGLSYIYSLLLIRMQMFVIVDY